MSTSTTQLLKYSPLAIGISILGIGALFVPWHKVIPYFTKLSLETYILILLLGTAFYVVRIIRYYYMLGILNAPRSFLQMLFAYLIAQPISLLPAGETYRIVTLKEHGKVPTSKGLPVVIIQSFTENIALVILALISAIYLNQHVLIIFALMVVYLAVFLLLRSRRTAEKSRRLINKLPMVSFAQAKFHAFIKKNKTLLSGESLVVLLLSGFASSLFAIMLLYFVANDLNIKLDFTEATIAFALPTVLQNLSFLPGGIGINEQGTVGILVLLGSSLPAAVALTLIMRFVTLVLGVILGLIVLLISKRVSV